MKGFLVVAYPRIAYETIVLRAFSHFYGFYNKKILTKRIKQLTFGDI